MPLGLVPVCPGWSLSPEAPNVWAGLAAARSSIRRAGFSLAAAHAACRAMRAGAPRSAVNVAAAAAWMRAEAVFLGVAFPSSAGRPKAWLGPKGRPAGFRLEMGVWSPGDRVNARVRGAA